ncbi:PAS domain-containing protein [Pseudomonas extremaustralis]|uniref:ATP-binding protein n=1 Tax=Pseudomonas extremaustralis TaxID=359110 RepID=UPI00099B802F|nr:ATP-binding protein [Pseudomonas extremaustralis]MDB1111647.1 PAS domain-containing protein [Pseudomonas extremaustralis]MDG2967031.1 PAS domain-containing protein [Pseudomonas extremaustralis]UUJ40491.1 PAS domain-containing protein [Pseudomonas extremaustralis]SKA98211.1 PAS domain S-box-containing protein [Pseudomonas extremaustralis]
MNGTSTGSEAAALIARLDWAQSPLGEANDWPQSLRTAVDIVVNSPMPMLLLWGRELIQLYNDGFARLAGNKHPGALGQPAHATWPELESFTAPVYDAVLGGQVRTFTEQPFVLQRNNRDTEIWLDLTYSPIRDEGGQVAGILVTAIETNERRSKTQELQQRSEDSLKAQHNSEQRLQLALAATDAVGTWDWNIGEDRFIADAHFAALHGVDPSDAGRLPISDYLNGVHPEDRGMVARSIKHCITHGSEYAEEYRLQQADGQVRWVFARGRCYNDQHGRPTRFLGAALDLTERKNTEQALRHLNENLEERVAQRTQALAEANLRLQNEMFERERAEDALRHAQKMEAVGQLTGGIAHDFNNMLTGIIGSLDLMQRYIAAGRSEEIGRFTDVAVSSAHRAAALTHRLLAFSRRQSLDRRPLDPNQLVVSLEDLFRRTKGAHIELKVQLGRDIWPVNTDASQLENALLNLVINARDAMPDGGQLLIETANSYLDGTDITTLEPVKAGDYVMLGVRDNGSGMAPKILAKAFDPFFTTKPIGQGTGLGLSMIYGFAQQSGGHVTIQSEPGQGTCVRLYLPRLHGTALQSHAPSHLGEAPMAMAGEAVVVVEDDPAVRMLVVNVLDELGYTAHQAADARTALPLLESDLRVDLLVTDVGLPGMNGRQLAEIARQYRPGLKVLFMTGYAQKAAERQGFLEDGMDMVAKPFSIDLLATKIRSMISV